MAIRALLAAATALIVSAHQQYVAMLPNGANVPGAAAIGHTDPAGGGARNAFGQQFWTEWVNKYGWNATFCCLDADADGQSNGLELGDPCCVWTTGAAPAFSTDISHPGIATSMTTRVAPACAATACPAH